MKSKFFVRKHIGPIDKNLSRKANRFVGNTQTAEKQYEQINTRWEIFSLEFFGEFMFTSTQDCARTPIPEQIPVLQQSDEHRWSV